MNEKGIRVPISEAIADECLVFPLGTKCEILEKGEILKGKISKIEMDLNNIGCPIISYEIFLEDGQTAWVNDEEIEEVVKNG